MQKFVVSLWYDTQAEEAAKLYVSLFKNSRIISVSRYGEAAAKASGMPVGSVLTVDFELDGQAFNALNGGPQFKFTEAMSIVIRCEGQAEIDRLWTALTVDGGEESYCGWLKDRFGVSWQIVPVRMEEMMASGDEAGTERMMAAMMEMRKLDLPKLEAAFKGE